MAHMDIFNDDAFSAVSMTAALKRVPYRPTFLGSLNLFTPKPVRTVAVSVEQKNGKLSLIQTSERGAPLQEAHGARRDIRMFRTVRLAKGDTIFAHEIQGIRSFGSESELQQVQTEVAQRLASLNDDLELTLEKHRLGAIQGVLLDADNSQINDWYAEFGISKPAEIDFALGTASTEVRTKCAQVIRAAMKASQGAWISGMTTMHALAGDEFFDALVSHKSVKESWLNWQAAAELRGANAYEQFSFGGITFHNYRGTDDGTSIAIGANKAHFFPVGAPGVFEVAYSPAETFDFVNTPGQRSYALMVHDTARNAWVRPEVYSYPLHICTTPGMLQSARMA